MTDKIIDLIEVNKDSDGQVLPIEKEKSISDLLEIPHDISQEYCDATRSYIDDQLILNTIISASNKPHLVRHLIDGLSDDLFARLRTIITHLKSHERDKMIKEIVNASFGLAMPTPAKEGKASELLSFIKSLHLDHEKEAKDLAHLSRNIANLSSLLNVCKIEESHDHIRWRLSVLPEEELDWMLDIARNRFKSDPNCGECI